MTEASTAEAQRANVQAAQAFRTDRDPIRLSEARTRLADSLVISGAIANLDSKVPVPFSIAAVGGYGRRELFPYSDIDLLILVENEADLAVLKDPLSEYLRSLWDANLRVSHSSRTLAECSRLQDGNTELHVSLLDLRFLTGDRDLFQALQNKLKEVFDRQGGTITRRLVELAQQRHKKFNNTVYHLEPNIKEAPGGIRDIHLLRWLGQLPPQHEAIRGSLTELSNATQFLFALRAFLHLRAGRDNNLLTFELQDEVARSLPREPLSPEAWMRLYYGHARRVFQCALRAIEYAETQDASLMRQFRDWRSRLSTSDFTISRDRIFLRNPASTLHSPESVLDLFAFVGRHGVQLSWDAQRRIQNESDRVAAQFAEHPPQWPVWRNFFAQPHTALALSQMQETCALAAALPEWKNIDSLVVRDFYHRYTVDEHTLVAIDAIDRLMAKKPDTPSRFHDFELSENDQAILRLAILLHDIGKGTAPGEHVRGSIESGRAILSRMHAPQHVEQQVLFLIEHHLDLSVIMSGRDMEDPATARSLSARVGTQEDLLRLTLLTYADISAVNPTAMTPWRLEQLWRVYLMGTEQLTRELSTDRIHEPAQPGWGDELAPEIGHFLNGLPKRYLRTHTREEIEHHYLLSQKSKRDDVAIEIAREAGAYLLTVLAHDHPGLFSALCGTLASFGMNIVKAEAASNAEGCILDLIRFTDPLRTLELNPSEVNRLEWTVECVVKGTVEVTDLLKRRRPVRRPTTDATIAPSVRFDNEASENATLVDFVCEDRPGLLYDLTSAIASLGCNIEVVMIETEAHRAVDVFYVTQNGRKLNEPMQERLRTDLLAAGARPS